MIPVNPVQQEILRDGRWPAFPNSALARLPDSTMSPYSVGAKAGSGNPLRTQSHFTSPMAKSSSRTVASPTRPFTAPAHKHAHHLHSIPPREKSTRTLIIDHMLWVHGRTRFAQARAELGMTDRTGGPTSLNYVHRFRPENFEEEEEQSSDGEDVSRLKIRQDLGLENHGANQEEANRRRDLSLAQSLNVRAESLEKVATAMLDQPPPTIEPKHGDENHPPSSTSSRPHRHPHTLPNGVRLRLALGTVINDLFARTTQSSHSKPMPSYQEFSLKGSAPNAADRLYPPPPPVIASLAVISASGQAFIPSLDRNAYIHTSKAVDTVGHSNRLVKARLLSTTTPHARAIYTSGAHNHPNPSVHTRCFRHLRPACDICAEPQSKVQMSGSRKGRANSLGGPMGHDAALRSIHLGPESGGMTGWRDGSGIGSGLAKPSGSGSVLRRAAPANESGFATTSSLELIPRFLRLSALVAIELGNEALPEGGPDDDTQTGNDSTTADDMSVREFGSPRMDKAPQRVYYDDAFRPSNEWYMLFAGLLTRAILDGYLTAGWKGLDAIECLLSVGLRASYSNGATEEQQSDGLHNETPESSRRSRIVVDGFEEFDPDELPTLQDAASILFPSSFRTNFPHMKEATEAGYESEMLERVRTFLDVSPSTTDLRAHLENLAQRYPVEAVERAAVRFCEAVAKWRGKPELETYKKKSGDKLGGDLSMESFIHSTPVSPVVGTITLDRQHVSELNMNARKPSIEKYFVQVQIPNMRDSLRKRPNIGRSGKKLVR